MYAYSKFDNYEDFLRQARITNHELIIYRFTRLTRDNKLETLQVTGDAFGLTRERVRQLENKFLSVISADFKFNPHLQERKRRLSEKLDNFNITTEEMLKEAIRFSFPEFEAPSYTAFIILLKKISLIKEVTIHSKSRMYVFGAPELQNQLEEIHKLLSAKTESQPVSEQNLLESLHEDQLSIKLLEEFISTTDLFEFIGGNFYKTEQSDSQRVIRKADMLYFILDTESEAMHFSEIADIMRTQFGVNVTNQAVLGLLFGRVDMFIRVGQGKYGLKIAGMISGKTEDIIADFIAENNSPVTFSQIRNFVRTQRDITDSGIALALNRSGEIIRVEDEKYALKKWGYIEMPSRRARYSVKLSDGIKTVLESASVPLTLQEISDRIRDVYGTKCSSRVGSIHSELSFKKSVDARRTMDGKYFLLKEM